MNDHDIGDWLPTHFEPPYASRLTTQDFTWFSGLQVGEARGPAPGWFVHAAEDPGGTAEFAIWFPSGTTASPDVDAQALCGRVDSRDEEKVVIDRMLQHPYSKDLRAPAQVEDWVTFLAASDAQAASAHESEWWAGDGIDAMVRRAEFGIVAYSDQEVALRSVGTAGVLCDWLKDALSGNQLQIELVAISRWTHREGRKLRDGMLLHGREDDAITGWVPLAVATDIDPMTWFEETTFKERPLRAEPWADIRMSGSSVLGSSAIHVLTWSAVTESEAELVLLDEGNRDRDLSRDWMLIHRVGTDIAIPMPVPAANLAIRVDGDGALVRFSVAETDARTGHHRRRAAFERHWGRWLDPTVTLSEVKPQKVV